MRKKEAQKIPIGIMGIGMVGSNLARYFQEVQGYRPGRDLLLYDTDPKKKFGDDVEKAHIVFMCVPTPRNPKNGEGDMTALNRALTLLKTPKVVVIKSTVPPGTTERVQKRYPQHQVLFNPEFLTESRAWEDMIRPDRQIVGHSNRAMQHASEVLNLLPQAYFSSPGILGTYEFVRLNATEAEMSKYAGNVFGALKVTYGNVLADLCRHLESQLAAEGINASVNYENIRTALSHDRRIGGAWLNVNQGSYRGFGGYCFPKDVSAFIDTAKKIAKRMPKSAHDRAVFIKAIRFLEAMWDYNSALLESQGHSIQSISKHDKELRKRKHV